MKANKVLVLANDALVPVGAKPAVHHAAFHDGAQGFFGDIANGEVHVGAGNDFAIVVHGVNALHGNAAARLSVRWRHVGEDVVFVFQQLQMVHVFFGTHPSILLAGGAHRFGQSDIQRNVFYLAKATQVFKLLREYAVFDDASGN